MGFSIPVVEKIIFYQYWQCLQSHLSYIDKISSLLNVCLAGIQLRTDGPDTAGATLSKALTLAEKFDADPNYGPDSYRFVTETEWTFSAVDSFGKKATESLEKLVELIGDKELTSLWKTGSFFISVLMLFPDSTAVRHIDSHHFEICR
ncbi:MAG: hypothetical protein IJ899_04980 [Blautia sp.]|nr:hypothetical protein [Blautia sp.]